MTRFLLSFFLIMSAWFFVQAQDELSLLYEKTAMYSDIVANAQLSSTKMTYADSLENSLTKFLETEGSFSFSSSKPIWLSIKSSEDNALKVYTWELKIGENDFKYVGFIQFKDGSYIKLQDESQELTDIEYMELEHTLWYGALYYNLVSVLDGEGAPYYILFGIHRKDEFTTEKIAEVIYIRNGRIAFGKPVFHNETDVKNRIHLSYAHDANVSLNYNESLNLIIFDHLISRMGALPGQGPTMLPDGSYSGYSFLDGKWIFQDKLYNQISETPPTDGKIRPKDGKDLFGKTKN